MNIHCYDSRRIFTFYKEAKDILLDKMPHPRMALVYPSRICNQACFYCSDRWGNKEVNRIMESKHFLALPNRLKDFGVESCELCGGGEPFLHPNIEEFIKKCIKVGLKLASLTNGTMLKGKLLELVVDYFSYIRISLDTFNAEIYNQMRRPKTKNTNLLYVLNNVKKAIALKRKRKSPLQIGLKICISKNNILDIMDIVNRARELKLDSIQIKMARNSGDDNIPIKMIKEGRQQLDFCKENFKDIVVLGSLDKFKIDHKCWLSPCHIFIDTTGETRVCCYYQFRSKKHTFGNVFEDSLNNIWFGRKHLEALKNIRVDECNQWDCKYFIYNKLMKEDLIQDKAQWQFV